MGGPDRVDPFADARARAEKLRRELVRTFRRHVAPQLVKHGFLDPPAPPQRTVDLNGHIDLKEIIAIVREEARAAAHETALALWLDKQAHPEVQAEVTHLDVPTIESLEQLVGQLQGVSEAARRATLEALLEHFPGAIPAQAVYDRVGQATGLRDPRQACQRVMRALRDKGLIMGGGKGSGTWNWSWPGTSATI